jgi:hypothetical protein
LPLKLEESRSSLKGKGKAGSKVFLHIARIEDIEDDKFFFSVSFVKRQSSDTEAWYTWPPNEDTSTVERHELVKLNDPVQDIVSRAGFRAKLF